MNMIRWIIQKTLAGEQTLKGLTGAVEHNGSECELIEVIPFDPEIKYEQKDDASPIIYGSSTFMFGSLKHPYLKRGVFYDEDTFAMTRYLEYWGGNMLNEDGIIIAAGAVKDLDFRDSDRVFVRPDSDSKSFSGDVYEFGDLKRRFAGLDGSNPYLDKDSRVLLARPKQIEKEWRSFLVSGKAVSSSRYRVDGKLSVSSEDTPAGMTEFCEEMCKIFRPHDVFVMDTALYQGEYKVIECNCFNGSGVYAHDWNVIVRAVEGYVRAAAE